MRSLTRFAFLPFPLLLACAAGQQTAAPPQPAPHIVSQVSFAVAGDVIPHEAVKDAAAAAGAGEQGWEALFADVAPVFKAADIGFLNMETPVAPQHNHGSHAFLFNGPVDLIAALKASGVKMVSFANNHVFDQAQSGFAETREHLKEQGMLFVGSGDTAATAWQPTIVEKNGIRVGVLGITRWLNGNRNPDNDTEPHVNFFPYPDDSQGATGLDVDAVIDAVKKARAQCDFLVVSIHWGVEYAPEPKPVDVDYAHRMLEAGATVIVGHHPHVVERVETYRTHDGRDALVFYSLGNFLSNQSRDYHMTAPQKDGDPRDELIGLFSVVKKDDGAGKTAFVLANPGIVPVWEENNRNQRMTGAVKTPMIRPVLMDHAIADDQAAGPAGAADLKLLELRRKILLERATSAVPLVTVPAAQPAQP